MCPEIGNKLQAVESILRKRVEGYNVEEFAAICIGVHEVVVVVNGAY